MYHYGKERKHKCTKKNVILDPRTKKCLKLSIKGKIFDKYVIPYIIGKRSFLDSFSKRDRRKFLRFLRHNHLLPKSNHYTREARYFPLNTIDRKSSRHSAKTTNFDDFKFYQGCQRELR